MPKLKRILLNLSFEVAQRKRKCTRNRKHVIYKDQKCLVIKENMDKKNYCLDCARQIINQAKLELDDLQKILISCFDNKE